MKRLLFPLLTCVFILFFCSTFVAAQDLEALRQKAIDRGVAFLRTAQQPDGSFSSPKTGIGPTAVVLAGLLDVGVKPDDPTVAQGLAFLLKSVREDGGVYTKDGHFQNYETCIALMCFNAANKAVNASKRENQGPYDELLAKGEKYIRGEQFTEEKGTKPEDPFYGGAGYGRHQRPDLSNTQFLLDTLTSLGRGKDDPAVQKALVFVSRCQNLESEHNQRPFASKNPDGGFIYTGATQESPAGETPDGGLRSYASMTYAGLKSMIYAGLTPEDKRVKAASDWIAKHYDLNENPGLGQQGLYYYYHTLAKTFDVMKVDRFEDAAGTKHDWKKELIELLASKQRENGSWVNAAEKRWMESDPNLVTGFVLPVLADCRP